MATSKKRNQASTRIYMQLAIVAALVLFAIGGLAFWANMFIGNMVRSELSAQKIYFPEKGSPSFDDDTYPDLQVYAGQLVDTPEEAKAYANGYIGRHLAKVANSKVYAEVSAEAMKDPTNQILQQQKATLFQGETLRGMLLTSGYGFGTMGKIAGIVAFVLVVVGGGLLVIAALLRARL